MQSQHDAAVSPRYDLLLQGGQVLDPHTGLSARRDVAIHAGRIAAVAPALPPGAAAQVVDVRGCYVTPGLIDMHVHVALNCELSIVADAHSFSHGVTTMVDAGSTGAANFAAFKRTTVDTSKTRLFAFLNIVDLGMIGDWEQDVSRMQVELAAQTALEYPGLIVGIKMAHYWTGRPWDATHAPWDNVDRGVQAGELCHLPVMVDFWPRPPERSYAELILNKLRPGDIHTHVFAQQFPILLEDGRVNDILFQARQRGVIFDLGHGAGSFWFRNAVPAIRQSFVPDSISTDLHVHSVNGLAGSLLHTMNKMLNMGLPLEEVIARATVAPAREIGHPELGTLAVGAEADVAVLTMQEGEVGFIDCGKAKLVGSRALQCQLTLRAGEVVYDPQGLTMPRWEEAPAPYWVCKQPAS
jgi:dihydroorotase